MAEISRDEIDRLANRLEELERTVPERATAFHTLLSSVLQKIKIRTPVHAWRLLRSPDLSARIGEAQETVALGEKLAELLSECDSLVERAHAVEELVRSCPDPVVSRAADFHLEPQRKALLRIGTGIDSLEALEPAQQRIGELRAIFDSVSRATPLFSEAIQIHRRLTEANDLGAAAIAADLKRWRAEFLNAPQPAAWVDAVAKALDGHRARLVANRSEPEPPAPSPPPVPSPLPAPSREPSPAPRIPQQRESSAIPVKEPQPVATPKVAPVIQRYSLAEIEDFLSETREWANTMTGDIEEVRPLADRKRAIDSDSPAQTVNELGDAVRELRDRLKREAVEKATRSVKSFNSWIAIYAEKCGYHPDLAALTQTLQSDRLSQPEDYSDFEENFNKAQSKFRGRINNDQARLHEALCSAVSLLRDSCQTAFRSRRSFEVDRQLVELSKRIPSPAKQPPQPAMQSIEDLEVCLQLEGELRSLRDQCLAISHRIETRREHLIARFDRLRSLLERLPGVEVPLNQIAAAFDNAGKWPADAMLDHCDAEISQMESSLAAAETTVLGGAEHKIENLKNLFEAADLELSMFGMAPPAFDFSAQQDSGPDSYIDVLDRAQSYEKEMRQHLAAAIENVRGRLPSLVEQVKEANSGRDSEPGNSRVVASLLAEYEELPSADAEIETLSQLRLWLQQAEVFLYSIQRAKHDIQNQIDEMISRLNVLRRQGGDSYYPRWVHRVEALVAGAGYENLSPDTATLQLAEARRFLDALERDTIQRISEEVQASRSRVASEMKTTRDSEFVSKARLVLRELERNGEHNLPPPAIVRQLLLLNDRAVRGSVR